jgi:hypothetical protein
MMGDACTIYAISGNECQASPILLIHTYNEHFVIVAIEKMWNCRPIGQPFPPHFRNSSARRLSD